MKNLLTSNCVTSGLILSRLLSTATFKPLLRLDTYFYLLSKCRFLFDREKRAYHLLIQCIPLTTVQSYLLRKVLHVVLHHQVDPYSPDFAKVCRIVKPYRMGQILSSSSQNSSIVHLALKALKVAIKKLKEI